MKCKKCGHEREEGITINLKELDEPRDIRKIRKSWDKD